MENLSTLRAAYRSVREALPWLDCHVSDFEVPFEDVPVTPPVPYVKLNFTDSSPRLIRQTDHSFEEIKGHG